MTLEEACIVLGLKKENIDEESLKRAYHEAARLSHPDANPDFIYASDKFAMIEEAYKELSLYVKFNHLNSYTKTDKANKHYRDSFYQTNRRSSDTSSQKKSKDRWDYYNEADRKFNEQRREEARRKMEEAFRRQKESERRKRQYEENMRRREKAAAFSAADPMRKAEASPGAANAGYASAASASAAAINPNISIPDKTVIIAKLKNLWDGFLSNHFVYDIILAVVVIATMITEGIYHKTFDQGILWLRYLLMWSVGILISRKFTAFCKKAKWANRIMEGLIFLIVLEIQIVIIKFFYI